MIKLLLLVIVLLVVLIFLSCEVKNIDQTRIENSKNFVDGKAKNRFDIPVVERKKNSFSTLIEVFSSKGKPSSVPSVKTNLNNIGPDEDIFVWLGHSTVFLQTEGLRILTDPVLNEAGSPVFFINTPFKGSDIYTREDIPWVDYVVITHDHYDHLSKKTLKDIKNHVGKVICPLGVGRYLKKWGYPTDKIIELDWDEEFSLKDGFVIYCLSAQHFSGRGILTQNSTLWASYLLQTPDRTIYFSGDSGYGPHFKDIGKRFKGVDLAFMENGQYNDEWAFIHMSPRETLDAGKDIKTKFLMPIHNSKYKLSTHVWNEPMAFA